VTERKIFAGSRIRRLRQSLDLSQAAMAAALGISPSYLNLVEHNQRPLTTQLLLKLAEAYELDLRELSGESEARLAAELSEALVDPVFGGKRPGNAEIMETVAASPVLAQAFLTLYRAYLSDARGEVGLEMTGKHPREADERFPVEEVRDYFHAKSNFLPEIDAAAEGLLEALGPHDDLRDGLRKYLRDRHGIRVSTLPLHAMPNMLRRFDRHNRRLFLSELLPVPSQLFQMAVQVALADQPALLDRLADEAGLSTPDARRLCRIGLANHFAGALMMPYTAFLEAAGKLRYDIIVLASRFGASIEQVAHRLTTLRRPGQSGVPFFLLRLDNAGNISKRFSAGGFHFARFGSACPRWRVHDAFAHPGQTLVQPVELPDGAIYLTISRTVETVPAAYPETPRRLAISLGFEVSHLSQVVYGDGLDLGNPSAITPIGVTCRLCERPNCPSRAFPPVTRPLRIDASYKNMSAFEFG